MHRQKSTSNKWIFSNRKAHLLSVTNYIRNSSKQILGVLVKNGLVSIFNERHVFVFIIE